MPQPDETLPTAPESESAQASAPASERLASLGRLAAGVAHEVNNPLAYVLGSLELLERGLGELGTLHPASEATHELLREGRYALANAKDGVERIRGIARDLMTFSRAVPDTRRSLDVEAILDSSLKLAWHELRHRARVVKCYGAVPEIQGEEGRLSQVFLNLLLNAAQAIPVGRIGTVTLSTLAEEGDISQRWVRVSIADDGSGIMAEDLAHVFEPFFTKREGGTGTGLGLAICRNIVTALGGAISVRSTPGSGTRFDVLLPAGSASPAPSAGDRAFERERVNQRARILIIDDEPLLGQTLKFAFQGRHDVEVVSSGREALLRLKDDQRFDLVLCDLMMPDVSGEQVFRVVSEQSPALVPRFVFMTGGAFTERAQEFLAAFPGRQLEKPFNIDEVELLLSGLTGVA